MAIYTKKGDKGKTSLYDGTRIDKNSVQVEAYGTVDELNAFISFATKTVRSKESKVGLKKIQHHLFLLAAEIATDDKEKLYKNSRIITSKEIEMLEKIVDDGEKHVPVINQFVLQGECENSSRLHLARTVCRRAERRVIDFAATHELREEIVKYLNRLSDALYMMARVEDELYYTDQIIDKVVKKYIDVEEKSSLKKGKFDIFKYSEKITKRAIAKANEINVPATIAVVDASGNLISLHRMKDAILASLELAPKKAYSAISMKSSTKDLSHSSQPGDELYQIETNTDGKIVTFAGGIPIIGDGVYYGAVGVSGGTVDEDQQIADYAISLEGEIDG